MSYLTFLEGTEILAVGKTRLQFTIINTEQEHLGRLEKVRVGAWMSWVLFLNPDCYLSASCLDEVREKVRELNAKKKVSNG
jgi:hypothetical protein